MKIKFSWRVLLALGIFSGAIATVALTLRGMGLLPSWRQGDSAVIGKVRRLPFKNATVHDWRNDNNLVLSDADGLFVYELGPYPSTDSRITTETTAETTTKTSAERRPIEPPAPGLAFSELICTTDEVAIIAYQTSTGEALNYTYRWDPSETTPMQVNNTPANTRRNSLDCKIINTEEEQVQPYEVDGKMVSEDQYFPKLMKEQDGMTKTYNVWRASPADSREDARELWDVIVRSDRAVDGTTSDSKTAVKKIQLKIPFYSGFRQTVTPQYDSQQQQYLWYTFPSQFGVEPADWSIKTWTVSPAFDLVKEQSLPAGPWVYPHGFMKMMSCFSCGCSCYERLSLQVENGELYIGVFGKAVEDRYAGIYKLHSSEKGESWKPVSLGANVTENFAVSPDGCQVAYGESVLTGEAGDVFIANTCQ
ncbi:MAG: hypothetical protein AAFP03_11210 [Cyanobacteria bacterium J06598_3]